ncbi:DUF2214 domain-containing protein [Bosea sp. (in: a-proteobacteria)]|uniref:DUF2214 domain-containing protein n=1 Tax=Bosea sp. (in: a-proteobacteria) TaxID=1871050 RepID=UPI002DDD011C|nr:DUF2214 domain-containing protein [Bosea sp. (in: a-proteobacteria)]HEV2508030.1 DUF2214 domain-containing protein [Bosea sp. (in: a-proteobacteria)]
MAALIDWLAGWPGAVLLQRSGTAYLFVNAAHILGIGLLLGAILPLDLRLAGVLRASALPLIGPMLIRTAACGLALALATGFWLFTVKPGEYLGNPAFLTKLGLLALALGNIVLQHLNLKPALAGGEIGLRVRLLAAFSASLWLCILVAGRWIGFV